MSINYSYVYVVVVSYLDDDDILITDIESFASERAAHLYISVLDEELAYFKKIGEHLSLYPPYSYYLETVPIYEYDDFFEQFPIRESLK